jgi:putative ABC transport system substrate-binding protein
MRRILLRGLLSVAAISLMIGLFSVEARAEKRIGVLIFSEGERHRESYKGVMDQLKKDGFGESAVTYTIENAKGNKAQVVEIVRKFAAAKMDLIITIGTNATVPAAKMIQDVPIVFSMVYDPVEAGIAKSWKSSGNNITGASPHVPMSILLYSLKEFMTVKSLAVLYTPGEKNSETHLLEIQKSRTDSQIKVVPVILTAKEEVPLILAEVLRTANTIYLTGSSIVVETVSVIVDMANKAKVITITHRDDFVEKGVLLGVFADAYLVGRLTGEKAAKILKGAKPSSIPIESVKKTEIILNMKTLKAGQFQMPPAFMKKVTKTIE